MKKLYDEEDFIVEPKTKQKKPKEDESWYPWDEPAPRKPPLLMEFRKKRALEEYNFRRTEWEKEQKAFREAQRCLEAVDMPRDIVEEILKRAGFYIPRVLVFS